MYFESSYSNRKINELSQKELLEYAHECFYYNIKYILRDGEIFALPEFLEQYKCIVKAIDRRLQLYVDNNYYDDDYFYWYSYRNELDLIKRVFGSYATRELKLYDEYIQTLPNKEQFLQPIEGRKQVKWFEGEIAKAEQFVEYIRKAFPFLKAAQIKRWTEENEYYRAVFYKRFFDYNEWEYRYDELHHVYELYNLYQKVEVSNKVEFTIYSLPTEESYDKLLGLEPCSRHPFTMQQITVTDCSENFNIDPNSFYCITAEFLMIQNGKWPTLKSFMEYAVKFLFPNGESAEVRISENEGIYYTENKFFNTKGKIYIGNSVLPFEADWHHGYSINEKNIKHLKVYILAPQHYMMGRDMEYVSEVIERYQPARVLSSVLHDFAHIRIARKGEELNPNKAIMMLSIHQAIQEGWIKTNRIYATKQLEALFYKNWDRYASSCKAYKPLFADSLYRLKAEPFCVLINANGEVDSENLRTKQVAQSDFEEKYSHVVLEDLHFAMLHSKKIAEVVNDIFLRLFESDMAQYYLTIEEIIRCNNRKTKIDQPTKDLHVESSIPSTPYPIPTGTKKISSCAYRGRLDITNLVIPEGVKSIGNLAFEGCVNIQSITFPESLTEIGNGAFKKCHGLRSISFGNKLKTLGMSAFARCMNLESVLLPQSLREIFPRAFFKCISLKSVVIPKKVKGTGEAAFAYCSSLVDLIISEGVEQIDYASFIGCESLKKVTIPASVHWVGDSPFSDTSLQRITYAEGNTTCYLNPYKGIPTLKEIDIPASCSFISTPFVLYAIMPTEINIEIGNKTYKYKDGVLYKRYKELVYCRKDKETLDVPAGIQTIGTYSLAGCQALRELRLPDSIKKIEDKAFLKCKNLSVIFVPNEAVYSLIEKEKSLKCQIIIENKEL